MAAGDSVVGMVSAAASAVVDLQPPVGAEWEVQNIFYATQITLQWFDGTNILAFLTSSGTAGGAYLNATYRCTNTYRLRLLNPTASAQLIGYSGVQTK